MNICHNGRFFINGRFINEVSVLEQDGKIIDVIESNEFPADANLIDMGQNLVAPAFIDLQIYGGNGKMFSEELSVDAIASTYEYSVAGGASQIMITMAT